MTAAAGRKGRSFTGCLRGGLVDPQGELRPTGCRRSPPAPRSLHSRYNPAALPEAHVAELLGHSGTAMLHKHYSHLGTKAAALRAALGRVRGG
jgi:hypothetical protein